MLSGWDLGPDRAVTLVLLAAVLLTAKEAPGNDEHYDDDEYPRTQNRTQNYRYLVYDAISYIYS